MNPIEAASLHAFDQRSSRSSGPVSKDEQGEIKHALCAVEPQRLHWHLQDRSRPDREWGAAFDIGQVSNRSAFRYLITSGLFLVSRPVRKRRFFTASAWR
jgi:hypothetical protein